MLAWAGMAPRVPTLRTLLLDRAIVLSELAALDRVIASRLDVDALTSPEASK